MMTWSDRGNVMTPSEDTKKFHKEIAHVDAVDPMKRSIIYSISLIIGPLMDQEHSSVVTLAFPQEQNHT